MSEIFANPKIYVVMLILCILLAMHYYTSYFTKRVKMNQGYLGSTSHEHTMLDTIETIARAGVARESYGGWRTRAGDYFSIGTPTRLRSSVPPARIA